jgi:Plasmid pRiA4b ORF-3-like protein
MIMQTKPVSKRTEEPAPTYQLHVVLSGMEPPIWRRLQVPATANLNWLHAVLQTAMGWTNSHLHHFFCGEHRYVEVRPDLEEDDPSARDESKFTVAELLMDVHAGLVYEYDFGDSWRHTVTLEKISPPGASTSANTAVCLAGSRACPPEDCGGLPGYFQLLEALKDKKHPEHRAMKEWLGRPFDPESFDVAKTNHWLKKLKWPRVTEPQLRKILMARDGYRE